jgi:hypothetical protein
MDTIPLDFSCYFPARLNHVGINHSYRRRTNSTIIINTAAAMYKNGCGVTVPLFSIIN